MSEPSVAHKLKEAASGVLRADKRSMLSVGIAALALMTSGFSAWTSSRALDLNRRTNLLNQRASMFAQAQSQYGSLASNFPAQVNDPEFRPVDGSDGYADIEAYWFFCFSEWYATHRVNPEAYLDVWSSYFVPLMADSLQVPSLRFVLEDIIMDERMSSPDWVRFLSEVSRVADSSGHPLSVEARLRLQQMGKGVTRSATPLPGAESASNPNVEFHIQ